LAGGTEKAPNCTIIAPLFFTPYGVFSWKSWVIWCFHSILREGGGSALQPVVGQSEMVTKMLKRILQMRSVLLLGFS
jgi:hypothetical protein